MTKTRIQLILAVLLVAAGVRVAIIFYNRHTAEKQKQPQSAAPLKADYYVTPKKLRAYDLESARELTKQPAWVQVGYQSTYYAYDPKLKRTNFRAPLGTLGPLEKLDITGVVLDTPPKSAGEKQVMAVFRHGDGYAAVPVGVKVGDSYRIDADLIFFYQNPRTLYSHWPQEVWEAIERHEVKPGMSELQVTFAVGIGLRKSESGPTRVLEFPNGGKPLEITFRDGAVVDVKSGANAG